jgi:hypothetical protein
MYFPDIDIIKKYTDFMRENGVLHLKFDDIEINMSLDPFIHLANNKLIGTDNLPIAQKED